MLTQKPISWMKTDILTRLIDLLAPRPCVVCGQRLTPDEDVACLSCLLQLPFTDYEHAPLDNPMAQLFWGQTEVEKAAALFFYKPHTQTAQVIYDLKYYHRPQYGYQLGLLTARRFLPTGFFEGIDGVIAVPLTRRRQHDRGYNQSEAIARGLCHITRLPLIGNALERTRFTESQTQQISRLARRENVEGQFSLRRPEQVSGKHILLVDDVVTTGATMLAAAEALSVAGDVRFSFLSLAFAKP